MENRLIWIAYGLILGGSLFAAIVGIGFFEYKKRILTAKVAGRQYWYLGALVAVIGLIIGISLELLSDLHPLVLR